MMLSAEVLRDLHKKRIYIGDFKTAEQAQAAYIAAAQKHYGEFARAI